MLELFRQQLHYASRSLRRAPGFTIVASSTLALGIGSATAVFGIVSAAFLRPLPYADPDQLIAISETRRGEEISVAYPNLLDFRAESRSFTEMAGFSGRAFSLGAGGGDGAPE